MAKAGEPLIIGAALGNCAHVAGVANFLRLAAEAGFRTVLLGAAVPVERVVQAVRDHQPDALAVSYRLTPANGRALLEALLEAMEAFPDVVLLFGGTARMVEMAEATGRFAFCFVGEEPERRIQSVFLRLRGEPERAEEELHTALVPIGERVSSLAKVGGDRRFVPMLRHHFGLPGLEETIEGVRRIAESEVLDVISVAPDQNAQEFFFRPDEMDPALDGAGGVPLRKPEDLRRLYEASRCGNYPYLRVYSGTRDLLKWAEMSVRELHNAWGTVPLTWYSELDGRSRRPIETAIAENLQAIRWYAERGMPVEVNESHHWSLRDAPDPVAVVMAYVAAYCAKRMGVRQFFAQYMFNTPRFTSALSDLAKMATKVRLIHSLQDEGFRAYRQVRAGLSHFSIDLATAKGQLAMATHTMLGLRPHILHVVGFSEASHAATPDDVIESCKIVRGVMRNAFLGIPDPLTDPRVEQLQKGLVEESLVLLGTLERFGRALGSADPLADPHVLAEAIRCGLIDAPHLAGQPCALGAVRTGPALGGCRTLDAEGAVLPEGDRLLHLLREGPAAALIDGDPRRLIGPPEQFPALPGPDVVAGRTAQ